MYWGAHLLHGITRTVNLALKEALRMRRIQGLADYIGKVEWHGDLSEMRGDSSG